MFQRTFSLAFFIIWAFIALGCISAVWWLEGVFPALWFRFTVSVLAGAAALPIETDLARRYARRKQLPGTGHRKATTP